MPDEPPTETNDVDSTDLQETECGFVELPMDLLQMAQIKPIVEASKRKRRGTIFVSCAPNLPDGWRMQAVSLTQKSCAKIMKVIREELASQS